MICTSLEPNHTQKKMNNRTVVDAWQGALNEAARNGLPPNARPAQAHAWATAVLAANGFSEPQRPDITSGFRPPSEQRELISLYDAGQREGFIGRPAECSWHMTRRAVDVENDVRGFEGYRFLLTRYTGARDGADFGDRGHFDWPAGSQVCV